MWLTNCYLTKGCFLLLVCLLWVNCNICSMCPCSGIQSARASIFIPSLIVKCVNGTWEVRGLTLVTFSTPGENPIAAHSSLTQTSHVDP